MDSQTTNFLRYNHNTMLEYSKYQRKNKRINHTAKRHEIVKLNASRHTFIHEKNKFQKPHRQEHVLIKF